MKVKVENKTVDISKLDVVGSGGEGLVVKTRLNGSQPVALKVYHQPSQERSRKLAAFFTHDWDLPTHKIALPQQPIYNLSGNLIVGVTMPYLGTGFEEVALFSNRKARLAHGITGKLVAEVFLDGHQALERIHHQGLIVGDFNDLNVLFRDDQMLWIDVDAWQFGAFPCPVATLEFIDPSLYGLDLSQKPVFQKVHDWYSFAVMLFRSLLLVHPYGGVHSKYKSLPKRAEHKITALDPGIKYPKIAFSPDILTDEMAQEFLSIFKKGSRGVFPKGLLDDYLGSLTECPNCRTFYPSIRSGCPICHERTMIIITEPMIETKNVRVRQMFSTLGNIAYAKVQSGKIFIIEHHQDKAALHTINRDGSISSSTLGKVVPGVRYALAGDLLIINRIHSPKLSVLDIGQTPAKLLQQSMTEIFAPNRKAVFQVTQDKAVRIVGGNIMAMEKGGTSVIERHIKDGLPNQTWFSANSESQSLQLFGFIQVLRERKYWYYHQGRHLEPLITPLNKDEGLVDISVKFSADSVLLRRKTQQQGVDYLRMDMVDNDGKVTYSNTLKMEDHPVGSMHGQTYSGGVLIHATDEGILQEKVEGSSFKSFSQTEPFVQEGDILFKYHKGLLVVGPNTATYLELTG